MKRGDKTGKNPFVGAIRRGRGMFLSFPSWKNGFLPNKTINKSFIFKNSAFIFKNKTFIFKNKTFIRGDALSFLPLYVCILPIK